MNISSVYKTTGTSNEEVLPQLEKGVLAVRYLTMSVSQDTNIFLNDSTKPIYIRAKYGFSLPENFTTISSLKVESPSTEVYMIYAY